MDVLMLSERDVRRLLEPDALLDALAAEFVALSAGGVSAPKRSELSADSAGALFLMPAYRPGRALTTKLVSLFHGNEALGLPGHHALICLFDAHTGVALSVMDGTYITAMRTAGTAALTTRLLARPDVRTLAIIGAGVQAHAHLAIVPHVREFTEIRIASRRLEHAEELASMDARAHVAVSIEEAVRGADVVCLCTNAAESVIQSEWLNSGTHVTSVGYRPPGGELDRTVIEQGHLFVETRLAFEPPPAGCGELAGLDSETGTEIGEVLSGARPGRRSETEVTVFKSMGHACEDMAAANLVYERARQERVGTLVAL